jgi:D-tyrosyl-tRNA(Tyr) deacylase
MIALIQRVTAAEVSVAGVSCARIDAGLLAFIGIRPEDGAAEAAALLDRVLDYRLFADEAGRMNRSLRDLGGGLLLVPQFTLAADTRKGLRPGFSTAAAPQQAEALFAALVARARHLHPTVSAGRFGEHMQVSLINDGPVTFWLES